MHFVALHPVYVYVSEVLKSLSPCPSLSSSAGSQRCICFCLPFFHLLQKLSIERIVFPPFQSPKQTARVCSPVIFLETQDGFLMKITGLLQDQDWPKAEN